MSKRVLSKSNQHLSIKDIADIYDYRERSLKLLFSAHNGVYADCFYGFSKDEVLDELKYQILEIEKDACLNLLASMEAAFRLDYAIRCEKKDKAEISKNFKLLFDVYEYRLSLEDNIFEEWKKSNLIKPSLIGDLKDAFKYRHWLAHGRYWTLKAGKPKYDFYELYKLAEKIINTFPLKKSI
jgi:hypothetical protein